MPRQPSDDRPRTLLARVLHTLFGRSLPLEAETSWFILANLIDYLVTYLLLFHTTVADGRFTESNPVAAFFLFRWGFVKGMLYFKLAVVAFVCCVVQIIATQRLEAARLVLNVGTLLVGGVVIYSLTLFIRHAS